MAILAPIEDMCPISSGEMLGGIQKTVANIDRATGVAEIFTEVKQFLRIDHSEEDTLLEQIIDASFSVIEERTGVVIRPTIFAWQVVGLPEDRTLIVDHMPLQTLSVFDDVAGVDVSNDTKVWTTYNDHVCYVRPPDGVTDFSMELGCGVFTVFNVWTQANIWTLQNVWDDSNSTSQLFDKSLLKQAMLITASELYDQRSLTSMKPTHYVGSAIDYVLKPLMKAYGV